VAEHSDQYIGRLVKEVIEIELNPENFNRDKRFTLTHKWYPMISMLKMVKWCTNGQRRPNRGRNMTPPTGLLLVRQYHTVWQQAVWRAIYTRHHGLGCCIKSLMMRTETVLETLVLYIHLTWLIAWGIYIKYVLRLILWLWSFCKNFW
jgi:hypothetical protein